MPTVTMEFWRDEYLQGGACLEYSWVPEGLRRVIVLGAGQQQGASVDDVDDVSHVQVYVTRNDEPVASLENWQFPPGGPGPAPIERARVELHVRDMVAHGTVWYLDGTTVSDSRELEPVPRPCPTGN